MTDRKIEITDIKGDITKWKIRIWNENKRWKKKELANGIVKKNYSKLKQSKENSKWHGEEINMRAIE